MNYDNYARLTGITQSQLAMFLKHGTAMDLIERETIKEMQYGCLFEAMIEEVCGERKVSDEFVVANITNGNGNQAECPREVVAALESGKDLKDLYVYKKDGDLNSRYETMHKWLDFYLEEQNLGKVAIPAETWKQIESCAQSALKCQPFEGDENHQQYAGFTLEQLLWKGDFQVCRQWESYGIQKKGLLDFVIENDTDVIIFDFKLTSLLSVFMRNLKNTGWLQCLHYTESYKKKTSFVFVVGETKQPFEAGAIRIKNGDIALAEQKYLQLCSDHYQWDADGRKYAGYRKPIDTRLWLGE